MVLITFILFLLVAYAWIWHTTYMLHKQRDMLIISGMSLCAVINCYYVYRMMLGDISVPEHILQMGVCSCMLPMLYRYFSRRMGQHNRLIEWTLWTLVLLTFIPGLQVYNPLEPFQVPESGLQPYAFYVLSQGEKLFAIYTGDLVVLLQSMVIAARIPFSLHLFRTHGLVLNRSIYAFFVFWVVMLVAIVRISIMDFAFLRSTAGSWMYFGLTGLLIVSFNILIILQYNIHMIETERGEAVENIEVYIQTQYSRMAADLRNLMEEQGLYRDSTLSADAVVHRLNTNKTYFAEMMTSEFKMSFNDYLNALRLKHVAELLPDKSLSITTIATLSGFTDARYMARRFKAQYGLTPTEWREA